MVLLSQVPLQRITFLRSCNLALLLSPTCKKSSSASAVIPRQLYFLPSFCAKMTTTVKGKNYSKRRFMTPLNMFGFCRHFYYPSLGDRIFSLSECLPHSRYPFDQLLFISIHSFPFNTTIKRSLISVFPDSDLIRV